MYKNKATFVVILILTLMISYVSFFGLHNPILGIDIPGAENMRFGIDIRGGVDVAFSPDNLGRLPTQDELESARSIIEVRLDQQNIVDRDVTIDSENGYIFVRYPWKANETVFDPKEAIKELGSTAQLSFKDPDGVVVMTGADVDSAVSSVDQENGMYQVNLKLKSEGVSKFSEATGRLIGKQISIFMDDAEISSPTVQGKITSEDCVINRIETRAEAEKLADQISAGALPFALKTDNYTAISPTLGSNALEVMVTAGLVALLLVMLFLLCYYRISGIVACISLLLQVSGSLLMLALLHITVTLPGIAGIILSIGMGVDANIIIAERIREELRAGKSIDSAITTGFKRAFSSVFDGNITVLIVSFIMLIFGTGAILSFAYTLLFGIIMNFVAGVFVTRLLTMSITRFTVFRKPTWFLSKKSFEKKTVKIINFYEKRKVYFAVSAAIMALGVVFMFVAGGVELGIEFSGGAIIKYEMAEAVTVDQAKDNVDAVAQKIQDSISNRIVNGQVTGINPIDGSKMPETFRLVMNLAGTDSLSMADQETIEKTLQEAFPDLGIKQSDSNVVAPFFGRLFLEKGITALILSAFLIVLYVWISFRKIHGLSAGVMALIALLHDVIVVFFTFVIFQIPIGDSFIAVALTILGYSINDTIVIYDRIRENTLHDHATPIDVLVNKSISQSLTRTINTALCVFSSVVIVFVFAAINGLESIVAFALPMTIGTICGCYSTICIAGPLWIMWQKRKQKLAKSK